MEENNDFGLDKNSELYKLLKLLKNSSEGDNLGEMEGISKELDNGDLGEPDSIKTYEEDGFTITVKDWILPEGEIRNIDIEGDEGDISLEELEAKIAQIIGENGDLSVIDVDITEPNDVIPTRMEDMLQKAVDDEDYELAAKIRDDIKERDLLISDLISEINRDIKEERFDNAQVLLEKIKTLKESGYKHDK